MYVYRGLSGELLGGFQMNYTWFDFSIIMEYLSSFVLKLFSKFHPYSAYRPCLLNTVSNRENFRENKRIAQRPLVYQIYVVSVKLHIRL